MSAWDTPEARPPSMWPNEGEHIEVTLTRLEFGAGKFGPECRIEFDRDGRTRYAPNPLWRTMYQLRPEVGDRLRIARLGQREWRVERLAAAVQAPAAAGGPTW